MIDELEKFKDKWLSTQTIIPPYTEDALYMDENVTVTTLYREGQFQVQLACIRPNVEIIDHCHPNVDSIEVYLGGQIEFRHNEKKWTRFRTIRARKDGACNRMGVSLRVRPNDWHGATVGGMGGTFLSIQHWIDIPVTSVHLNWKYPIQTVTKWHSIN